MWPYWVMFLMLAFPAMIEQRQHRGSSYFKWLAIGVLLLLFIGLRHQVGGDWFNYLGRFNLYHYYELSEIILKTDPGYAFLNWQVWHCIAGFI